jgi:MinD superfamily P-loop ATPase
MSDLKSIVVLSGKGGVGKSSISASLALTLSKDKKIICADCDVDASNLSLLFSLSSDNYVSWKKISTNQIAKIYLAKCKHCGLCSKTCYFDSIEMVNETPVVDEIGCEGCGACQIICPNNAITLENVDNANLGYGKTSKNLGEFNIVSAQLFPGSSGSGKVVSEVRNLALDIVKKDNLDFMIVDSAAGIGCPVIASVTGNNFALIVTEPTPSGFSDMKKAFELVKQFRIPCGIVINKSNINLDMTKKIETFAQINEIDILSKFPFDKKFVEAMNEMIPLVEYDKNYVKLFDVLKNKILKIIV